MNKVRESQKQVENKRRLLEERIGKCGCKSAKGKKRIAQKRMHIIHKKEEEQ